MNRAILISVAIITNCIQTQAQFNVPQLQAGVFINDTIVFHGYSFAGYCDSLGVYDVTITVSNDLAPIATGVELRYIVFACPSPPDTAYCIETGGFLQVGDTLPFSSPNSHYTIYSTPYAGGVLLALVIIGTPTVPFENYPCSLNTVITLADCGNAMLTYSLGIPCTVNNFVGVTEISSLQPLTINPNPTTGNSVVTFSNFISNGDVRIFNLLGAEVFSERIFNSAKKEIKLPKFSSGIYFVRVIDGEKSHCKKLIVE